MLSSPDSVGKSIMFSDCPSAAFVRSFVRTDLVTTMFHKRLEESMKLIWKQILEVNGIVLLIEFIRSFPSLILSLRCISSAFAWLWSMSVFTVGRNVRWPRRMLPLVSHGAYADGADGQTDGRQTVTLRFPLWTRPRRPAEQIDWLRSENHTGNAQTKTAKKAPQRVGPLWPYVGWVEWMYVIIAGDRVRDGNLL